jgi:hypothetical protein
MTNGRLETRRRRVESACGAHSAQGGRSTTPPTPRRTGRGAHPARGRAGAAARAHRVARPSAPRLVELALALRVSAPRARSPPGPSRRARRRAPRVVCGAARASALERAPSAHPQMKVSARPSLDGADLWTAPGPFLVAELAAVCRLNRRTIEKAIEAGVLRACRVGAPPAPGRPDRRAIRIPASAARQYARDVGAEPAQPRTSEPSECSECRDHRAPSRADR